MFPMRLMINHLDPYMIPSPFSRLSSPPPSLPYRQAPDPPPRSGRPSARGAGKPTTATSPPLSRRPQAVRRRISAFDGGRGAFGVPPSYHDDAHTLSFHSRLCL